MISVDYAKMSLIVPFRRQVLTVYLNSDVLHACVGLCVYNIMYFRV